MFVAIFCASFHRPVVASSAELLVLVELAQLVLQLKLRLPFPPV
jgi:hypothetical protein